MTFRVFTYGQPIHYVLEIIGILGAIGAGTAVAMVNVVLGQFMNILSDFTTSSTMPEDFMNNVQKHALYFVYIGIARFVLTYVYTSLFTYVAYHFTRDIRHAYLRAALSQEISYFDHGTGGSIAMQANSNGKLIQSGIAEKLGLSLQAISTFVAAFIIAFISQWKLTLIIICIIPVLFIVVGGASAIDAGLEVKSLKIYGQAGSYAENILGGVRTVSAFSLRSRVVEQYGTYLRHIFTIGKKKNLLYGIMFGGEYFVVFAGMGLAFWQGIAMLARGEVDGIGTIFTVLFSVVIAASSVLSLAPHTVAFSRAATAAAELFTLIDRPSAINPFDTSGARPESTAGVIEIEGLDFTYPTRPDARVLENFTLQVPAGKVTALVGASGSGKSTIIGLLERWYNPDAGTIKLDGINISELNLMWLRTNVRLVQQEPVLFDGSVFDNIVNGLVGTPWEDASPRDQMTRVQEAAKLAFAHDFILGLPKGYDTRVGQRGGILSGGQKQRVAIARSIISEPKILLLDEATSALDPHAEGIVQQALDRVSKDRTTIVIAHKLATIRNADNIVVMSAGKILEQGHHDALVAQDGAYAKLVKAQDLSPSEATEQKASISDEESTTNEIEPTQTVARYRTTEARQLAALKDLEDYELAEHTGVIRTIIKLVMASPELNIWYALTLATCLLGAAVYPGQALLLGNVMDIFSSPDMVKRGNFIALMFFVMSLGIMATYFVMGWSTNMIAQTLNVKTRRDLLDSMLKQDLRFFDRPENTVGALIGRLDSYPLAILELMGFTVALVVMCICNVVASSILSVVVSWKLGLVGVFAGLPPLILAGYARIRLETKMESDIGKRFSASSTIASETVMAIRTVSSLAIEKRVLKRYMHELDTAIHQSTPALFNMMIWFSLTQAIEYFILALGFWWGSKLVFQDEITFYQFIVSFMGVFFVGQAAGQFLSFASSFTKANDAANYYFWLRGLQPSVQETNDNKDKEPPKDCDSYEFENVQFSYPLAPDIRVLKGISLKIECGQFVAFVGASGSGKSTMIALLERFYDPTSGTITIDENVPLPSINPRLYRSRLALVQQEPTLFPGSIRDNIAQGMDVAVTGTPATEADIERACRAANAWDFVSSLPDGLNTACGTSGSQLSGGQRQRIAIARALVRDPKVVLLDEATSALDTQSERVVQAALMEVASEGDRITVAVAHRLSTVRDADRIFVFFGGRIVEAGTHGELVEKRGMYHKMCEAQRLDR
ncbi:hypothetical protein ACHAQH_005192 [Verticillium albo-atrum]